jgi:sulfate adenylyltransferase
MLMTQTIPPHGGDLVDLLLPSDRADAARAESEHHPKIALGTREASDLEMLAVGAMSPLTGFMLEKDYRSVLEDMRLASGLAWSMPITLSVSGDDVKRFGGADVIALTLGEESVAHLEVEQVYRRDREEEAAAVFQTKDPAHPGVRALQDAGEWLLGGTVRVHRFPRHDTFVEHRLGPAQTREAFERRGWRRVGVFQTRNPVHRAHEYLQKCALEMVDGLLLHPLVGDTKADDVPAVVRMECYRVILEHYYPVERVLLSVLPATMRYAGPREAVFHAIIRRNYGCTHFIVGRDHAGVGNFYGTYDAQKIFDAIDLQALGIQPLKFEHTFFCVRCGQMVSPKTCPHGQDNHVFLSGTSVREMLCRGQRPPAEFSRPEVADVLARAYSAAQPA